MTQAARAGSKRQVTPLSPWTATLWGVFAFFRRSARNDMDSSYHPLKFFDDLCMVFGAGSLVYLIVMAVKAVLEFWAEYGDAINTGYRRFVDWLDRKQGTKYINAESWWASNELEVYRPSVSNVDAVGCGPGGNTDEVREHTHAALGSARPIVWRSARSNRRR